MWSININLVAQVLFLIHWGSYSSNGIGLGVLREVGFYLMAAAEVRLAPSLPSLRLRATSARRDHAASRTPDADHDADHPARERLDDRPAEDLGARPF